MSAMPQSLSDVLVHIVFSTKNRTPWITPEIRRELYPYLGAVIRDMGCVPIQIGGVEDHVHFLLVLSRTITIAQVVEKIKTPSSKWMKTKGVPGFAWQGGYGAFSVSASERAVVVAYILGQEEHHRKVTFQDEFRAMLKEHGIAWDERYVWD
jgi:REP element-mobilizing transposase RayT